MYIGKKLVSSPVGHVFQPTKNIWTFLAVRRQMIIYARSLRSAMAGRLYKHHSKHTSNSGLTKPLCRANAIFYSLPNNEWGTKYRGLPYSAK